MEKISFKLMPRPDGNGKRAIVMVLNCGLHEYRKNKEGKETKYHLPVFYPTGQKILPDEWIAKPAYRPGSDTDMKTILNNFEDDGYKVIKKLKKKKELSSVNIKAELDSIYNPLKNKRATTLNEYISEYIQFIEDGTRLTKGDEPKTFSPGTVKIFKTFKNVFKLFQEHKNREYNFNSIDAAFYEDYRSFLTSIEIINIEKTKAKGRPVYIKEKYSPNNVGSHLKRLKSIMLASKDKGLHDNNYVKNNDSYKIPKQKTDTIYLNDAEVRAIYDLKNLTEKEEIDRDVFLVGCYTVQRFGDYSMIVKSNVRNGLLYLIQDKGNKPVVLPLKQELITILEKYDYNLPKTYEQRLNVNIKGIARKAGITTLLNYTTTKGGVLREYTVEKCTRVSSHTARRSGCTNLYRAGINPLTIMFFSGHSSLTQLLNYIKVTAEDVATDLANHEYFKETKSVNINAPMRIAR